MRLKTITFAALALAAGFLLADPAHAGDGEGTCKKGERGEGRKGKHALKRIDADGDGRISREEAAAAPRLAQHFAKLDANGDGYVTKDEMKAARAGHRKDGEGRKGERRGGERKKGERKGR